MWASNEQNYVDFFYCIFLYHFQIDIKYIKCVSITIYSMLTFWNRCCTLRYLIVIMLILIKKIFDKVKNALSSGAFEMSSYKGYMLG